MLKSFPKILIIFFLTVFIFQLSCLLFLALAPAVSQAADPATFKPQVEIPGMKEEFGAVDPKTKGYAIPGSTASIAKYVRAIYKYAIGIVGILAAVVLMIGGVMWIVAGGSATRIGEAKAWIGASLTGLLLALLSYTILATVNPALVNLQVSEVKTVDKIESSQVSELNCTNGGGVPFQTTPGKNEEDSKSEAERSCWRECLGYEPYLTSYYDGETKFFCCQCYCRDDGSNLGKPCTTSTNKDGYCTTSGDCLPCKIAGASCSGMLANYECCNGDCQDAPGIGTGNICN